MSKKYLILSTSNFFKKNIKKNFFYFISKKEKLKLSTIKKINPKIIFVTHWNWIIPEDIFNNYSCIGFHCTPLPYGRGGSPMQNMIIKGHKKTQICAIKIIKAIDAGPVYSRKIVSLSGSGNEIFLRMYKKIIQMIYLLCRSLPKPVPQKGKPIFFSRRKPHEGDLKDLKNINAVYDYIRMLDIDRKDFTKAFVKTKNFTITFSDARLLKNGIYSSAFIKKN